MGSLKNNFQEEHNTPTPHPKETLVSLKFRKFISGPSSCCHFRAKTALF